VKRGGMQSPLSTDSTTVDNLVSGFCESLRSAERQGSESHSMTGKRVPQHDRETGPTARQGNGSHSTTRETTVAVSSTLDQTVCRHHQPGVEQG